MGDPQRPSLKANILIVDDTPGHLHLLSQILHDEAYHVQSTDNGVRALQIAQAAPPDLILLDIMMPDMTGYQVCERLKADERTRDIPIIFISALGATRDKVKAFTAGGVDYVTKPFQIEEVLARVKTHATLRIMQKQLEESEQLYRLLAENAEDVIWTVDNDFRFTYISPSIYKLRGLKPEEAIQESIADTLTPESSEVVEKAIRRGLEAEARGEDFINRLEIEQYCKDGSTVWVEIVARAMRDEAGQKDGYIGVSRNIAKRKQAEKELEKYQGYLETLVDERTAELATTNEQLVQEIVERKQAEQAAQDSERRFRALFENAPLCILEIDLTQAPPTIIRANQRATQVYGWSPQEIISAPVSQIVPQDAMPEVAQMVDALRAEKTITIESVHRRRDGALFPVRVNASSASPNLDRVILVVEDITAERIRRSEKEAIEEERRRIAQEIHDGLAQNLAALRFRARQWHKLVDADPPQMHAELDELRQILSDSIIEVRRSIFALRPIALEKQGFFPTLRSFAAGFGKHYQVRVNLNISGPRERLPTSLELTLIRVIQEALNNVGKHAQANAVWITLDIQVPGTTDATSAIALNIRDDGKGFDLASLDHAAEYGHFGLKQMRERIEQVHGTLSIQSQPGSGTEIQVTLPLHARR